MSCANEIWNRRYGTSDIESRTAHEPWLDRWRNPLSDLAGEAFAPASSPDWSLTLVNGVAKQFFSTAMICELAGSDFELVSVEARNSDRYGKEKSLLECEFRRLVIRKR